MRIKQMMILAALLGCAVFSSISNAQFMGNGAGQAEEESYWWFPVEPETDQPRIKLLDSKVADKFIQIDGTAEIRVEAKKIRAVLAVVTESKGLADASKMARDKVDKLVADIQSVLKLPKDQIHEDFISFFPFYGTSSVAFDEESKAQSHRHLQADYFRYQTNLHVALDNEAQAKALSNLATAHDIADLVAFDYWDADMDEHKKQVRKLAIKAAKEKADLLLELFDERPRLINIQEATKTILPSELYTSFDSRLARDYDYRWGGVFGPTGQGDAQPPQTIFYQRLPRVEADVRENRLPLKSEISIVSTVILYFESPAARKPAKK